MKEIAIAFKKEDVEIKELLSSNFGDNISFLETKGFDGNEFVFVAIIPITALSVQIVDFFLSHFSNKKNTGRVIIKKDRSISIEGYTADEVVRILESL